MANSGNDDVLDGFSSNDFDCNACARVLLENYQSLPEQVSRLKSNVAKMDEMIMKEIADNLPELLVSAEGVTNTEDALTLLSSRIASLSLAAGRLFDKVNGPCEALEEKCSAAEHMQDALNVMRKVNDYFALLKRYETMCAKDGGKTGDPVRLSSCLNELRVLLTCDELRGVDAVESTRGLVQDAIFELLEATRQNLRAGVAQQNVSQIVSACHVFSNFGSLPDEMYSFTRRELQDLSKVVDTTLDPTTHGLSPTSQSVNSSFKAKFWTAVEQLFLQHVRQKCERLESLQAVLWHRRDPCSGCTLADDMALTNARSRYLIAYFFHQMTTVIAERMKLKSTSFPLVKEALEAKYPELLKFVLHLSKNLSSSFYPLLQSVESAAKESDIVGTEQLDFLPSCDTSSESRLISVIAPFESAYLSRSMSIMSNRVELCFPDDQQTHSSSDGVPSFGMITENDVQTIVREVTKELEVSAFSPVLSAKVAKNAASTLGLFCAKCEGQLFDHSPEATQIMGPATGVQKKNARVTALLCFLQRTFTASVENIRVPAGQQTNPFAVAVKLCNERIASHIENSVQPLLESCSEAAEAIILTRNQEVYDDSSADSLDNIPRMNNGYPLAVFQHDLFIPNNESDDKLLTKCSLYMGELHCFMRRMCDQYLSIYERKCRAAALSSSALAMCSDIVFVFVELVCATRPVSTSGRLKLASDCAMMRRLCQMIERTLSVNDPRTKSEASLGISRSFADDMAILCELEMILRTWDIKIFKGVMLDAEPEAVSYRSASMLCRKTPFLLAALYVTLHESTLELPHQASGWTSVKHLRWLKEHRRLPQKRISFWLITLDTYSKKTIADGAKTFDECYPVVSTYLKQYDKSGN